MWVDKAVGLLILLRMNSFSEGWLFQQCWKLLALHSSLNQPNCWLPNVVSKMSSSHSEERICERRKGSFYTVIFLTINIL